MSLQGDTGLPAAYDTLNVGIALYDPETGSVVDANERLEALFGYDAAALRGLSVDRYSANTYTFSEADFLERLRAAADGDPQQFTWRVKRASGELVWVRVHLSRTVHDGRSYALAEVRDITDYYTASRREALFWRVLRHNLRNEATVIAGQAERIEAATESEEVSEAADVVQSTAMGLGDITESVKEIQRAATQTEKRRVKRHATDAVRDVAEDLEAEYKSAEVTVDEREAMWVRVDSAFEHALGHAVENAIIHSDDPEPTVEITVGPSPNTGRVEVRVADTNSPIPAVEIDTRDEFAELTSTSHGSGVGLFVMKWCIESLGGEFDFERRTPRGNVVHFYLPPREPPETR